MPPRGIQKGTKRARQYEHIKQSQRRAWDESRPGRGDRRANGQQGARAFRRIGHPLANLDAGHVLVAAGRSALRYQPAEGPHPRPALQRGEAARGHRSLEHEQGAAAARGRRQEDADRRRQAPVCLSALTRGTRRH